MHGSIFKVKMLWKEHWDIHALLNSLCLYQETDDHRGTGKNEPHPGKGPSHQASETSKPAARRFASQVNRLCILLLFTAICIALGAPTSTTSFLPRVIPV